MIDVNPAKLGVDNPTPRRKEQRPFESWAELDAVVATLPPRYGPMVLFADATGLRPAEWLALERRDVDREARVVYVRRSFTKGRLKCTKTEASLRAVPLQAIALDAIEHQRSKPCSPCSSLPSAAATSTCTTSATGTGSLRNGKPLRKANGMPFTLPFSPDTIRWRRAAIVELRKLGINL